MTFITDTNNIPFLQQLLLEKDASVVWVAADGLGIHFNQGANKFSVEVVQDTFRHVSSWLQRFGPDYVRADGEAGSAGPLAAMVALYASLARSIYFRNSDSNFFNDLLQRMKSEASDTRQLVVQIHQYVALVRALEPYVTSGAVHSRRMATAFRENSLYAIFRNGVKVLVNITNGTLPVDSFSCTLLLTTLDLLGTCLTFPFGGVPTSAEGDSDVLMIPSSWRAIRDDDLGSRLFAAYTFAVVHKRMDTATAALRVLVSLGTIRRSFHGQHIVVQGFVKMFINGCVGVLNDFSFTKDEHAYHEVCRLVGRFASCYHGSDLRANPMYDEFLSLVASLTKTALRNNSACVNSNRYLLLFWSSIAKDVVQSHSHDSAPIAAFIVEVATSFVQERLE